MRGSSLLTNTLSRVTAAIDVTGLRKSFGRTNALDGLDLAVASGEVHGFLGPNGSGKTTTIRVLLGLIRADGGTARLLGGDPWREATTLHRRLAYVPGDVTLWPNLTGGEVIDLLGRLRGGLDAKRRSVLLERFELDPTKKSRAYSKGNRQKVALVAALASGADLLILDEPTSGLDPLMEAAFRACVEELAQPPAGLAGLPGVHDLDVAGTRVRCQVDNAALNDVLSRLTGAGVRSLVSQPPTLEELFLRQYTGGAGP